MYEKKFESKTKRMLKELVCCVNWCVKTKIEKNRFERLNNYFEKKCCKVEGIFSPKSLNKYFLKKVLKCKKTEKIFFLKV